MMERNVLVMLKSGNKEEEASLRIKKKCNCRCPDEIMSLNYLEFN